MTTSRSILFITASLGGGGAERVLCTLANAWARRGVQVQIVTLNNTAPFYPLLESVEVRWLGLSRNSTGFLASIKNNACRLRAIRGVIKATAGSKVVSFGTETNILSLLAAVRTRRDVIVSERCDPRYYPYTTIWSLLRCITYLLAHRVVVQTRDAERFFWFLPKRRLAVIPNPVSAPVLTDNTVRVSQPFILAAGRLTPQKGFDVLLEAFAVAARRYPNWRLVILGEGPSRDQLEAQVKRLSLVGCVDMPGAVQNIGDYMNAAAMFVLSSRYEGFPNVLCEAMASGMAVVATDCPSGPADIVSNGVDGRLVKPESVEELARAIGEYMSSPDMRLALGNKARAIAMRLSVDTVLGVWEEQVFPAAADVESSRK